MRYYDIEGRKLPSVTTILDATMTGDRRAMLVGAEMRNPLKYHQKITAARARGNQLDGYAKAKFMGTRPPRDAAYVQHYMQFDRWFNQQPKGGIRWADEVVYDLEKGYAGTLDIVAPLADGLTLLDIKTTAHKAFKPAIESAMLQTAAYWSAWVNAGHPEPDCIAALFISPYGAELYQLRGEGLSLQVAEFYRRQRQFGAALSAMSA